MCSVRQTASPFLIESKNILPPLLLCLLFHICHLEALYISEHMKQNMIGGFYHTSLHLTGVRFLPVSAVLQGLFLRQKEVLMKAVVNRILGFLRVLSLFLERHGAAETATCLFPLSVPQIILSINLNNNPI